jgi:nucleoside-diphosphate-sugar epimerase
MKILIVGDDGLIGTELKKQIKVDYVGLEKGENIFKLRNKKFDCIIHLGANCIIREVITKPELALENVQINHDVFEFARRYNIPKIIYFSSSRVLANQSNPYIASKLYGENLCKAYSDCFGIDYLIIRPETVWSIEDKHKRVITAWIEAAKENKDIIIYGKFDKQLSPIHVESFVIEFLKFYEEFMLGKIKNVSKGISGESYTVYSIAETIKNHFNSKSRIVFDSPEKTQPQGTVQQDVRVNDFVKYLEIVK